MKSSDTAAGEATGSGGKLEAIDETCPQCGMARSELYSDGKMGCARCYQAFGAEVQQALKEIHGETRHLGKNAA